MPLSTEFENFYQNWLSKSDCYSGKTLQNCFDQFFTLFVIYNRLYAETTFVLARRKQLNLANQNSFPDAKAAKSYVIKYMTSSYLISQFENDPRVSLAITQIKDLIRGHRFYIKLDMLTGDKRPEKDEELLQDLESQNSHKRAKAIMDVLYSIRCNMFHGHKGFEEVQQEILIPVICILRKVVVMLYNKLRENNS